MKDFKKKYPSLVKDLISERDIREGIDPTYIYDNLTDNQIIKEVIEQHIHKAIDTELEYITIREYLESVLNELIKKKDW